MRSNSKKLSTSSSQWESRAITVLRTSNGKMESNGPLEAAINSVMMISRTIMVESGLGSRFWFKSAAEGCEARNVTYKARIGTTPWKLMPGENNLS